MGLNLFKKRKDPVCGMIEKKDTGLIKENNWFCSQNCVKEYEKK